jgi:hypothetical protein
MNKLTDEQIEAIQNQQAPHEQIYLSDEEIVNDKSKPTDYVRKYISAYKNKGAGPGW